MSFTVEVKTELCEYSLSKSSEKTVLYGFLYSLRENAVSSFFTEVLQLRDYLVKLGGDKYVSVFPQTKRGRAGYELDLSGASRLFSLNSPEIDKKLVTGADERTGLFLRGVFLASGIVADPNKEYHLELAVSDEEKCDRLERLIVESGMKIKCSSRKGQHFLYTKDSEGISDFLTYIGAMISSMEIMNAKIYKGVRNNVNRAVNCENANIEKTVAASQKQLADINYIIERKKLDFLSEELRSVAEIRRDNNELSLSEIGELLEPKISRSAVYRRLKRIGEIAEQLRKSE